MVGLASEVDADSPSTTMSLCRIEMPFVWLRHDKTRPVVGKLLDPFR